jgi:hypothetical protein
MKRPRVLLNKRGQPTFSLDFSKTQYQNAPTFAFPKSNSHRGGRKRTLPEAIGPRDWLINHTETDRRVCVHASATSFAQTREKDPRSFDPARKDGGVLSRASRFE